MDADRFDALSRALSTTHTRRRLTRLLGGLNVGGALSARSVREAAAALRNGGSPCTRNRQRQTGKCVGPTGNKTCSCSKKYAKCKNGRCQSGHCVCSDGPTDGCCRPAGLQCSLTGPTNQCCFGSCNPEDEIGVCEGQRAGGACSFNAQCYTRLCRDGFCRCPSNQEACQGDCLTRSLGEFRDPTTCVCAPPLPT